MCRREQLPDPVSFYESEGVVPMGRGVWRITRCVFRGGSHSLRVPVTSGRFVSANCCVTDGNILEYVRKAHDLYFKGAEIRLRCWDGESQGLTERRPSPPLPLRQAVDLLAQEARTLLLSANDCKAGRQVTESKWARLLAACPQGNAVTEEFGT